jgi:hypothetical protein
MMTVSKKENDVLGKECSKIARKAIKDFIDKGGE